MFFVKNWCSALCISILVEYVCVGVIKMILHRDICLDAQIALGTTMIPYADVVLQAIEEVKQNSKRYPTNFNCEVIMCCLYMWQAKYEEALQVNRMR